MSATGIVFAVSLCAVLTSELQVSPGISVVSAALRIFCENLHYADGNRYGVWRSYPACSIEGADKDAVRSHGVAMLEQQRAKLLSKATTAGLIGLSHAAAGHAR
jgi:hypothetical protein